MKQQTNYLHDKLCILVKPFSSQLEIRINLSAVQQCCALFCQMFSPVVCYRTSPLWNLKGCKTLHEQWVLENCDFHTFSSLFVFYIEIVIKCQHKDLKEFWCTLLLKYAKNIAGFIERGALGLFHETKFRTSLYSGHWNHEKRKSETHCILKTINFTEEHKVSVFISRGENNDIMCLKYKKIKSLLAGSPVVF